MSRTADAIRDAFLANLRSEGRAAGVRFVTAPKTPFWALGTALGLELEGAEAEAEAARREAFPGTASEDGVLVHADADGLVRASASHAVLRVRLEGTPSSILTIPDGKVVTDAEGLVYLPPAGSVTIQSSGFAFWTVTARDPGSRQNLAVGATLTWQGAPAGFAATMTTQPDTFSGDTTHVLIVGSDDESIEHLRARCEAWWIERAQGGNRAEWAARLAEVEGAGDVFIYPRSWRRGITWGLNLPGVLTAIVLAPAPPADSYTQLPDGSLGQGLLPTTTRVPTTTLKGRCVAYLEGTVDAAGRAVPSPLQVQRRPVGIAAPNYAVTFFVETTVSVTLAIETDPAVAPWPWGTDNPATRTVTAATTTTLTLDSVTGIKGGSRLAVELGTGTIRGGWWTGRVASVGTGTVTLDAVMPAAPSVGAHVRPDAGIWAAARAAVLALIDQLGPGDTSQSDPDGIASARYPRPGDMGNDRLTAAAIITAIEAIDGVTNVTVTLPGGGNFVHAAPGEFFSPGVVLVAPL